MRACWSALLLPVGNETATEGFLTAWPAATFAFRDYKKAARQHRISKMEQNRKSGRTAMNWSRGGGHEHGMLMLFTPLQLPVPSGLVPATTPKSGTSDWSTPPLEGAGAGVGAGAGAGAGAGVDAAEPAMGSGPAWIAATWAPKVVAACGQPTPGPWMFWSVTVAALRRASADAFELSSGKEMPTEGLLITWPAATFWFRSYTRGQKEQRR